MPCYALAFDVGDPTFRLTEEDPITRVEVFAEWFDRDVDLEYAAPRLGTPSTGPQIVGTSPPPRQVTEEADQLFVRWVFQPLPLLSTHFDVGFDGKSSGGDQVVTLGGAARVLLTESGPFQLSTHFVPEFSTYETGTTFSRGPYVSHGEYEAYEYGAALIGSMTANVTENVELVTYMAPRLSAYRGDFRAYADFSGTGERMWVDGVAKQSSPFGLAVGSRVAWGKHLSARVEGRFAGETSLTVGLGAAY